MVCHFGVLNSYTLTFEYHGVTYIDGRDIIKCTDLGNVHGV